MSGCSIDEATLRAVYEKLDRLPQRLRAVIELKYLAGYANREIAGLLKSSERTIERDLKQGRDRLEIRLGASAMAILAAWTERIRAIRANASEKSHAELEEPTTLDDGNPAELGRECQRLRESLRHLNVLGGCRGTDALHVYCAVPHPPRRTSRLPASRSV